MSDTSPSARILADMKQVVDITDLRGRSLKVRSLGVLEQARLYKAIGPEQSSNEAYVRIATAACMISQVDELPCPMPRTAAEVDAAIARMGDEAYMSVIAVWSRWVKATGQIMDDVIKGFETDVKN